MLPKSFVQISKTDFDAPWVMLWLKLNDVKYTALVWNERNGQTIAVLGADGTANLTSDSFCLRSAYGLDHLIAACGFATILRDNAQPLHDLKDRLLIASKLVS